MALATGSHFVSSAVTDKYLGAIRGALVADAASMGLHWIYDTAKLKQLVDASPTKDPAFFDPPSCPFYQSATGQPSPYGAEALSVLHSLSSAEAVSGDKLAADMASYLEASPAYKNKPTKLLIANLAAGKKHPECGADDSQANSIVKAPIVVARYAGSPDFLAKVEETVRAHQNHDGAVRYGKAAALLLDHIARGATVRAALDWAVADGSPLDPATRDELAAAAAAVPADAAPADASAKLGSSCGLPGALLTSAHILRSAAGYEDAVRRNILAGGDQCSRALFIGACFAAENPAGVPDAWAAKVCPAPTAASTCRGGWAGASTPLMRDPWTIRVTDPSH
jgi:hypothetical protein